MSNNNGEWAGSPQRGPFEINEDKLAPKYKWVITNSRREVVNSFEAEKYAIKHYDFLTSEYQSWIMAKG